MDLYINIKKHENSFIISLFQLNYNVFISFWKRNNIPVAAGFTWPTVVHTNDVYVRPWSSECK